MLKVHINKPVFSKIDFVLRTVKFSKANINFLSRPPKRVSKTQLYSYNIKLEKRGRFSNGKYLPTNNKRESGIDFLVAVYY